MTGNARLSDRQKSRAVRIARDKDLTCPDCDSSEPVPKDEARTRSDGGADVAMCCVNCESASEITLVLSPEEAKALGLHALRDDPQTP
jgi:RNase P subunit RPR2